MTLTTGLAAAYAPYKTNLAAVEYYRRNILPDQVRYYRGVFERRKIDPNAAFGDLVTAQQILVADVTAYLGVLGSLWTSVVSVADFLQTDDLFQLGKPLELPQLPDLDALHAWPCPHPSIGVPAGRGPAHPDSGPDTRERRPLPRQRCHGRQAGGSPSRRRRWRPTCRRTRRIQASRLATRTKGCRFSSALLALRLP